MSTYYRFLAPSERITLWSIFICQTTITLISWYGLRNIQQESGCAEVLIKNYSFFSPYTQIPHECTSLTGFWLRINRYTMYLVTILFAHIACQYFVSLRHLLLCMYTWLGLFFNADRAHEHHSLIYRDAPFLVLISCMLLSCEKKPFEDWETNKEFARIQIENDKRRSELEDLNHDCIFDALDRALQSDDGLVRNEIFRQMHEQQEKNRLSSPLLELPRRPPLEGERNFFFGAFLYLTSLLLFSLAIWNFLLFFIRFIIVRR